jgi:Kef-type K+ transport system membrane component KefB
MAKNSDKPFYKRLLIDIAGFGLILSSGLVGWLPGPGGIPVLLAGLGLLATNHEWAERLLNQLKNNGTKLYEIVFPENKSRYILYDLIGITLLTGAILVKYKTTKVWLDLIGFIVIFFCASLLLLNRKRLEKFTNFVRRRNTK